jgi:PKD domain
MGKRGVLVGVLVALVGPASAHAATFCVPDPSATCSGTDANTIALALTAAAGNGTNTRDTIRIAPGTYTENDLVVVDGNPVDIIGAGESTVITRSNDGAVIILRGESVLSDVKVEIPVGLANTGVGGQVEGGRIERVLVEDSPANSSSNAILGDVDVLDSRVLVPTGGGGGTAILTTPDNFVRRSHVEGVVAFDGVGLVEDSTAFTVDGFHINDGGEEVRVRDVLLHLDSGINPTAFELEAGPNEELSVDARNVTVIGPENGIFPATGVALFATGEDPGPPENSLAEATLRNVVLHGMDRTFGGNELTAGTATAITRVNVAYSSFDPDPAKQTKPGPLVPPGTPGEHELVTGPGNIFANPPGFVSGSDFRPGSCASPLIDAGEPVGTTPGDVDAAGLPRQVAAKSQLATTDIGAFEYQYTPPVASITATGSPPFNAGETIQFDATIAGGDGGPYTSSFSFGDGGSANGTSVSHAFDAPGTYNVQFAAAHQFGCLGALGAVQVEVGALPRRIALRGVRMTRKRFRVGKKRTPKVAARARVGTTFIYSVDRPATASIRIDRLRKGKPPKRAGTLRRRIRSAGQVRTPFSGRIGRKALKPGRYRATITASASGSQTSAARRLTFRVVR